MEKSSFFQFSSGLHVSKKGFQPTAAKSLFTIMRHAGAESRLTMTDFMTAAKAYEADMLAFFRDLHQYPEPSHFEIRTNARVREVLGAAGIELLCPAENITIAVVRGARPGKTIGMRLDTDALQMQELTDLPYKSKVEGMMHGCGHDAHTTVGVYAALMLNDARESLCGVYKIIFQPAEEGERGASEVIATGLVDDVDAFYGLHVWSPYPTGTLHATAGGMCACPDMFKVTIHGRGGHGAAPHSCVDPIAAGAAVVQSLQHIVSRFVSPMQSAVVTIGSFHAGTRCNIIAQDAVLEGTLRCFDDSVHEMIFERFHTIIGDVAHAHGCTAEIEINHVSGVVVNDAALVQIANQAAAQLVPQEKILPQEPSMLGDDFADYRAIAPCCYVQAGMNNPRKGYTAAHHHGLFTVDEDVLPLSCAWMALSAAMTAEA